MALDAIVRKSGHDVVRMPGGPEIIRMATYAVIANSVKA